MTNKKNRFILKHPGSMILIFLLITSRVWGDEGTLKPPGADDPNAPPIYKTETAFGPPDPFPDEHPPMPEIVAHGDRDRNLWACAYCHLTSGSSHPESVSLQGLTKEYMFRQVKAFQRWERVDHSGVMPMLMRLLSDDEIMEAADYYSRVRPRLVTRVVETKQVPESYIDAIFMRLVKDRDNPKMVALGDRVVTLPEDQDLVQQDHPHSVFIAYVPEGSIARGRKIVLEGADQVAACTSCHGMDMKGTDQGPYLAGQHVEYLVRQIRLFKEGHRRGLGDPDGLMGNQVRYLREEDIIPVAAYIGSLPRD